MTRFAIFRRPVPKAPSVDPELLKDRSAEAVEAKRSSLEQLDQVRSHSVQIAHITRALLARGEQNHFTESIVAALRESR